MTSLNLIRAALESLVKANKGQYIKNVVAHCNSEHGWSEEQCLEKIEQAVRDGIVSKTTFKKLPSLRIVEDGKVVIEDNTTDKCFGTEIIYTSQQDLASLKEHLTNVIENATNSICDDFIAFKRHTSEINSNTSKSVNETLARCEGQLDKSVNTVPLSMCSQGTPDLLYETMKERIESLENVVKSQAETIRSQQALLMKSTDVLANMQANSTEFSNNPRQYLRSSNSIVNSEVEPQQQQQLNQNGKRQQQQQQQQQQIPARVWESKNRTFCIHDDQGPEQEWEKVVAGRRTRRSSMKKRIEIIGDSMLNNIDETKEGVNLTKSQNTRIYPHSGLTSLDMLDLVKVSARRQPEAVIIHVGSNDLNDPEQEFDTIKNLETTFQHLRNESPETEIAYSTILHRYDQRRNLEPTINQLNAKAEELCKIYNVAVIKNDAIDGSCLGQKLWHPNSRGKCILASNWHHYVHYLNNL